MPERRRVLQRAESLGEIDEILGAMKSLAFVEIHRIANFIDAQRQAVELIETAAADFLADYSENLSGTETTGDILCLLGAERGLCGDFNANILKAAESQKESLKEAIQIVVVGTRLADALGNKPHTVLEGPSVLEEVPAVIARLLHRLTETLSQQQEAAGLILMYQDANGIRLRRLLPFTLPPVVAVRHAHPLDLQVPPGDFFLAMAEHYLYAVLHAIFYESLLEENRQRLEHMQRARDMLADKLANLDRRQRKLRQEEITQEIELILLSAGAVGY